MRRVTQEVAYPAADAPNNQGTNAQHAIMATDLINTQAFRELLAMTSAAEKADLRNFLGAQNVHNVPQKPVDFPDSVAKEVEALPILP